MFGKRCHGDKSLAATLQIQCYEAMFTLRIPCRNMRENGGVIRVPLFSMGKTFCNVYATHLKRSVKKNKKKYIVTSLIAAVSTKRYPVLRGRNRRVRLWKNSAMGIIYPEGTFALKTGGKIHNKFAANPKVCILDTILGSYWGLNLHPKPATFSA